MNSTNSMWTMGLALAVGLTLGACGDDEGKAVGDTQEVVDTNVEVTREVETQTPEVVPETSAETVEPDTNEPDTTEPETIADTTEPETIAETVEPDTTEPDTIGPETVADTTEPDTTEPETIVDTTEPDTTEPETIADTSVPLDTADTTETADVTLPVGNVFVEGSFELWVDGLPVGWLGDASNLTTDSVLEDASDAHDGLLAAQLINAGDTHKRFSSAPQAFAAGRYACTYWVRGAGEIRNTHYDGGYGSYSGYTTIDDDAWRRIDYTFNVAVDEPAVELVFSIRNSDAARGHLHLDDVSCERISEVCDALACASWQTCRNDQPACETASAFCADAADCESWETCDGEHRCVLATGFCEGPGDCGGGTPICDLASHTCTAGDPCGDVTCNEWEVCNPVGATCDVSPGRCETLADCDQALPVCDKPSHTCVAIDTAANVVPNGGFEAWSDFSFGGPTTYLLPDFWYGLADGGAYFPETEIAATAVKRYTTSTHGGESACQLIETGTPADRFTTEPFTITAAVTYECAYWVRGHGTYRQRVYAGAWGPDTDYSAIDSDTWQQVRFEMSGSSSRGVLNFYASNTVADRDHIQLDDVVCIRK